MTRGRHANHVHVTAELADQELDPPRPLGALPTLDDALRMLQTATTRVGTQQAAHTPLDQARQLATTIPAARVRESSPPRPTPARDRGPWASPTDRSRRWSSCIDVGAGTPGRSIEM